MVGPVALSLWLQLSATSPDKHLPPLPTRARIVMGKPTADNGDKPETCTGVRPPKSLYLRRMIAGFHLEKYGDYEAHDWLSCPSEGFIYVGKKTYKIGYRPDERVWTTWPDGKEHSLIGPNDDCCNDDPPPLTHKQQAQLRWYGLKP